MCLSQEARAASAHPGFFIMKRLKVTPPPFPDNSSVQACTQNSYLGLSAGISLGNPCQEKASFKSLLSSRATR